MSEILASVASWAVDVIYALGYVGVVSLIALESIIVIIPSEVILPLAGFLAGLGRLWLPGVVAAATLGSMTGALILYGLGHWLGEERLRWLVRQYGRWLMLRESDLDQAWRWFDHHGGKAVFFGRLVPGVRSLVSVPAGLAGMPLWRFLTYTVLGSSLWNVLLVGLGWILGENWNVVSEYTRWLEYAVLLGLAGAVIWFIWQRSHIIRNIGRRG